ARHSASAVPPSFAAATLGRTTPAASRLRLPRDSLRDRVDGARLSLVGRVRGKPRVDGCPDVRARVVRAEEVDVAEVERCLIRRVEADDVAADVRAAEK